jgi:hypothetical protein
MKNLVKLLFVSLIIFSAGSLFSQYASTVTPFPFVNGPAQDASLHCVDGLVYDDGTWENGYGWNPGYGIGKFVMQFTPNSYPYTINQVCLALTRLSAGSANWTFAIEVWTYTAGGPGTLVVSIPNQVATAVGVWPTVTWHDFTGITTIPPLTSGSYYVGISWDPVTQGSHYIGADESSTTPLRPGYGYIQNAWGTIQSFFASYKAIGVRVDGIGFIYTHNIGAGPFLSLPLLFNAGTQYPIKARIKNFGTSNETGIPVKFFVNGAQLNSTTLNLNAGAVDSVSFNWTPADSGNYTLAIVSALPADEYRANDTVKTIVHVYPVTPYPGCVGNGTIAAGWPFYTFYMDSRTDMLYLGSEIYFGASLIQHIGFNVISAAPQVMNGFMIKMKNTTDTSISGFTSTGWTTVYSGTYSVPGTGWRWINLQTPFVYNGTNLLIEICFDNTTYTSNTTVASHVAAGRIYHYHTDGSTGCTMTGTNSATSRPNICGLTYLNPINQNNKVLNEFSLSQNYPNPFNPSTAIKFSIPKTSMVNLAVYDVLGREVMILVNDVMKPGEYSALFDASELSSGVYFCKIVVRDPSASSGQSFTDTKKMLLVK